MKKFRVYNDINSNPIYAPEFSEDGYGCLLEPFTSSSLIVPIVSTDTQIYALVSATERVLISEIPIILPTVSSFTPMNARWNGELISVFNTAKDGSKTQWTSMSFISVVSCYVQVEFFIN